MAECITCKKTIKNIYVLDNKQYGYNCYKLALSLKLAYLQELKNDEYAKKCLALITIFEQKKFTKQCNINFKESIIKQWYECKKLTSKQFNVILKKFDELEYFEYLLTLYQLDKNEDLQRHIYNNFIDNKVLLLKYKLDKRVYEVILNHKRYGLKKGKKYFIVTSKDIEDNYSITELISNVKLEELKSDEYIEILEVIEIN